MIRKKTPGPITRSTFSPGFYAMVLQKMAYGLLLCYFLRSHHLRSPCQAKLAIRVIMTFIILGSLLSVQQ